MAATTAQKRRIKEEAGFRCAVPHCNTTNPLDIHHIQHQENGGLDTDNNLICLCKNCHGRVHQGEIPEISIRTFKGRLVRISADLMPHEIKYLEALNRGENIELDEDSVDLARRIERLNFVQIQHMTRNDVYRLSIMENGRQTIR